MATLRWSEGDAKQLHAVAKRVLHGHTHLHSCTEKVTLDNCAACALAGRNANDNGPNYTGWERLYVEAQESIPKKWKRAFERSCFNQDNQAYLGALRQSIATFGYPKFK